MAQRAMRIAGRCAEVVAYLCGAVALGVIVRHIAILLEYVTIGPLPFPLRGSAQGTAVYYLFERMGLSDYVTGDAALIAGLVLTCAGAVRLRDPSRAVYDRGICAAAGHWDVGARLLIPVRGCGLASLHDRPLVRLPGRRGGSVDSVGGCYSPVSRSVRRILPQP